MSKYLPVTGNKNIKKLIWMYMYFHRAKRFTNIRLIKFSTYFCKHHIHLTNIKTVFQMKNDVECFSRFSNVLNITEKCGTEYLRTRSELWNLFSYWSKYVAVVYILPTFYNLKKLLTFWTEINPKKNISFKTPENLRF